MFHHRLARLSMLLLLGACTRDVALPDPPAPGSITGRVLLAEPGRPEKRPVEGAEIRVLGSGLATTTSRAGVFTLENMELTSGLLLLRVSVNGVTRQRVIQLADYATGKQRHVNLGDLVIGENARVRGRALRGDVATAGGHFGTTVFVPAGPFTALTADDGTYSFDEMPEGPIELYVFRTGYEPATLGTLSLRSGETVELRDLVLQPATSTAPGALRGSLTFIPSAQGKGDSAVRLVAPDTSISAVVNDDLTFAAAAVPVGLYRLIVTRSGYGQVEVINVLVVSGADIDLGVLTVTTAPVFDAGPPPTQPDSGSDDAGPPDAGPPDAGAPDAGPDDAGAPDAGPADAGPPDAGVDAGSVGALCTGQVDCHAGEWCDRNRCVPLCQSDAECGFGRVCDLALTHTCQTSCVGQCASGQVCNAQNVCQSICDNTFPCVGGLKCSAGMCVPECTVTADCNNAFLVCDMGSCKRSGLCTSDNDCTREEICVAGQCGVRPTDAGVRPDGGVWTDGGLVFACAQACHCKSGERCADGFCEPDVVPTRFIAKGATGNGATAATASGDLDAGVAAGGVVGLLATDTWDLGVGTVALGANTHLAGGFTACGTNRWVRDRAGRTVITGTGTNGVSTGLVGAYSSNSAMPLVNVALSGLTVRPTGTARCASSSMGLRYLTRPLFEDLDLDWQVGVCPNVTRTVGLKLENATEVTLRRVRLTNLSGGGAAALAVLELTSVSGLVEDLSTAPFTVPNNEVRNLILLTPVGATTLRRLSFGRFTNPAASLASYHLWVDGAAATPVSVEDVAMSWPVSAAISFGQGTPLYVRNSGNVHVRGVTITSTAHPGGLYNTNFGVYLDNSGGTVDDVRIELPTSSQPVPRVVGLMVEGPAANWAIDGVTVRGSGGTGRDTSGGSPGYQGLRFENILSGPLSVSHADVSIKNNISAYGVNVVAPLSLGAQASLTDSVITVEGTNTCSADVIGVLAREALRLERNVITASNGSFSCGVYVSNSSARVELYGNSIKLGLSNGSGSCSSAGSSSTFGSYGLVIDNSSQVRAIGNTIEPYGQVGQVGHTVGLSCGGSPALSFQSNIVATGRGSDNRLVTGINNGIVGTGCFQPSMFSNNYFFNGVTTGVSPTERLFDGGILLDGGNVYGGTTSCFAPAGVLSDGGAGFPHNLAPGSPCADRGVIAVSNLGVLMDRDLFGRARDGGAGPDIGAVEGP